MEHRYEIILKAVGDKKSKSPIAGTQSKKTPAEEMFQEGAKALAVYSTAKKLLNTSVSYEINNIALRTGQKQLQQQISFGYEVANKVVSVVESMAVGAATGGFIGAAIGTVIGIMFQGIQIAQAQNQINMQRNLENISIKQNNLRAGVSMSRNMAFDNP